MAKAELRDEGLVGSMNVAAEIEDLKVQVDDICDCIQKMTQEIQVERLDDQKERDQIVEDMNRLKQENEERDAEHNKLSSLVQGLLDTFEEVSQDNSKHALEWEDFREEAGRDFEKHRKLIDYLLAHSCGDLKAAQAKAEAAGGGQIMPQKTFGEKMLDSIYASVPDSSDRTGVSSRDAEGLNDKINELSAILEVCKEDCARFQKEKNEVKAKVDELENDVMRKSQFEVLRQDVIGNASKVLSAEQEIKNLSSQLKAHRQELNEAVDRHEQHAGSVKTQLQSASSAKSQLQTELQSQLSQINSSLSAQQSQMTAQLHTQVQSHVQARVQEVEQRLSQSVSAPATPSTVLPPLASQKSGVDTEATESLQKRTGELERRVATIYEQVNTLLQQDFVPKKDYEDMVQQTRDAIQSSTQLDKEGGGMVNDLKQEIDKNHRMVWQAVLQLQMKQHQDTKRRDQTILPVGNPESYPTKLPGGDQEVLPARAGSLTVNSGTPLRSGAGTPTRVGHPTVVRANSTPYLPMGKELNGNSVRSPTPLSPRAVQPQQVNVQPTVVTAGGIPRLQTTPVSSRSGTPQPVRVVSPGPGGAQRYSSPIPGARKIIAVPKGTQIQVLPAPQAGSFNAQGS